MNLEQWSQDLTVAVSTVADRLFQFLPALLGAIAILLAGWLVAHLLAKLSYLLVTRGLARLSRTKYVRLRLQESTTYRSLPDAINRIVFWLTLLFFIAVASEVMGLPALSGAIAYFTSLLPGLFGGLVILVAGIWIGEIAATFFSRAAAARGLERTELVGRTAQWLIVALAVILALGQLGIDNTVLMTLMVTVFAAIVGSAALAFAFGARTTVANIIAAHYIRRLYSIGDRVTIGEVQGTITEMGPTYLLIESENGVVSVPAEQFNVKNSTRLSGGS